MHIFPLQHKSEISTFIDSIWQSTANWIVSRKIAEFILITISLSYFYYFVHQHEANRK